MAAHPDVSLVRDPEWLAHRYDERADAIRFIRLPRAGHRAVTFITEDHLPKGLPLVAIPRRAALAAAAAPAPLHFVFHSAFCCSTLIAAALDREGVAMGLKEPVILNDMVGWRRRGAAPRDVAEVTDGALALLARPFAPGESVIVKPSNIFTGLARLALSLRPDARALLLTAPLPVFLTSVAKKGLDGRLWVRELFIGLRKDGLVQQLGFDDAGFFGQTDLQIAAAGWLAQQAVFAGLIATFGPDRVRSLDSETLLAAPDAAMAALANFYGLALGPADIADIVRTQFSRDAKSGKAFGRADRDAEYRAAGAAHGDEIGKVAAWAEAVANAAGIPMRLGAPLLG